VAASCPSVGYLQFLIESIGLRSILAEEAIRFETFADNDLPRDLDDRSLWRFCQANGWVLFTNDKNNDGPDSLQATLHDSWHVGLLPVLTLANQGRFRRELPYARQTASDIAEVLYGIASGEPLYRPRIFVPGHHLDRP